jgi:hypothetical protein
MAKCPRCDEPLAVQERRCELCGLPAGAPFDPTAAFPEGGKYIGRMIGGHFRVISVIAFGGHGIVLLVRHTTLEHRNVFALKLLKPDLSHDQDFRRRFLREVEIVYTFSHPNIVPIREFAETEEGELFFSMDFCRGVTLEQAMHDGRPLPLARTLRIMDGALQGLAFAHGHGIVHRDMKPANVFLQEGRGDECVRLLDFGIAKPIDRGSFDLTGGEKIIGTPAYMAPEQILGQEIDARTDLYALGIILYRMVAGQAPFKGRTGHEILARHLRDAPVPLCEIAPAAPRELGALVDRMLSKDRARRPASAEAVREELAKIRLGRGAKLARKPSRAYTLGIVTVLGAAIAGGGWFLAAKSRLTNDAPTEAKKAVKKSNAAAPKKPVAATKIPAPPVVPSAPPVAPPESPVPAGAEKTPAPEPRTPAKWCRLCRKNWPEAYATCPDCGQVLGARTNN